VTETGSTAADSIAASNGEMLRLEGVVKRYGGFTAVAGLDLSVRRGEIFGFLGPNGAGKTTTIRMVAGVLQPTSGRILVGGNDLSKEAEVAKQRIGYIPDRPFLYEKLSGGEFLRFVAGLWGKDGPATEDRANRLLELFNLRDWKDALIESYSHGMRQKILISSALVHQPELIVVDEPMVGLDPRSARILKDLLRSFVDSGGTVFLTTHTLEVAEAVCDRIGIMSGGKIVALGTMDDLRAQAHAGGAHLEEIFLKVTHGEEMADVVAALKQEFGGLAVREANRPPDAPADRPAERRRR
jgi:ABC-2 type transport system ATP-binding protein